MIRMTKEQDFIDRMNNKFPDEPWTPIKIRLKSLEESSYRCDNCGTIYTMKNNEIFRNRKEHLCSICYKDGRKDTNANQKTIENFIKEFRPDITQYSFIMKKQKNNIKHHCLTFICPKCNQQNTIAVANLIRRNVLKGVSCSFCEGVKNKKNNTTFENELQHIYPNKFLIIKPYTNANENIRVRCNKCGFIRDVKPTALLRSGYCPKCDTKISKGERTIAQWLLDNHIEYIPQKYFRDWNIGIHYFDFYLPKLNIVIEYHGRQHYEFVEHFHLSEEEFEERRQKDKIKKETALKHGLNYISINYHNYNNLGDILSTLLSSTTIWQQKQGECLEIETIQDLLDKDIVSTSNENWSSS